MVRLDPVEGHEMRENPRPVLVLSPDQFNRYNPPLCAPITQGGNYTRVQGFAVTLTGTGCRTQGAIIVSQIRTLDLTQREAEYIETVPHEILLDCVWRLQGIIDP